MQLIRGIHNIRPHHFGCVLTIGNFDGVHLGHVEVLKGLVQDAKRYNLPSTVMLFERQPQEFFAKDKAPARLTRLRDKLALLAKLDIDRVICVSFTQQFAQQSAEYFVQHILVEKLGVKALTVGDDFKFGHARRGDFNMLKEIGESVSMHVKSTASLRRDDCRVSSTLIRAALAKGDLDTAHQMLGHTYTIAGRVIHGWKKGRELGFRTANIALKRQVIPVQGVFAVRVNLNGKQYKGVANVGTKPTLNGTKALLEVHLFDFNQDVYGHFMQVELVKKLRNEQKFDTLPQLTAQIATDVADAKQCFNFK
ncbi:bifunctional riboflavin kinase/FAD synthetase [Pseudoalteromonas sp. MMG013]|uniref:Riboflavin biosynthesis protein n=1 Tax=Pseudoalteromonas aurantia 208 TaxID=1314867 RepID=A0ABR9E8F0_9GAMM|nr:MULTISPECIES: bifunctional riboflavin kinase/FAD synthetase [Pseudoalteromonas]MBE0367270.1 riboflavin kinase / FMN adenylyltransferase [Pseudoalteromonas aurantia 208]MBQ4845802.1 bifunctional riboflavin kinase/FAD synthetase [Pseudoalteromonas sp. MMG005]MBQ4848776.1 bifunctional riboflavin kinase/FAD synthetase [Pseudoalteromonas sp. MMG012]MBQ4861752.1 bifunctional riboflavin kinase/FAD synthetase [Pseudoalteromonas sp. MMG013]